MWQDSAACIGEDSELFASGVASRIAKAKAICAGCPVTARCLAFAITNDDYEETIYGGLTGAERRAYAGL